MYAARQEYCEGYRHVVLNMDGHGPVATCTKSGSENQGTLEYMVRDGECCEKGGEVG